MDGLFVLTAEVALFMNSTALELTGLPNTTEYIILSPNLRSGALTQVRPHKWQPHSIAGLPLQGHHHCGASLTYLFDCALRQAELAGPAFGTQGTWAGRPQAALSGTYNNQLKTVLLQLNACAHSPAAGTVGRHPDTVTLLGHLRVTSDACMHGANCCYDALCSAVICSGLHTKVLN